MKNFLLLVSLCFLYLSVFSQKHSCGTTVMTNLHLDKNLVLKKAYEEQKNQESILSSSDITYTIPVVFHILYNTSSENVSSTVIQEMFNTINKDYTKTNLEFNNPPRPDFLGVAADVDIQFCLATVDDQGNTLVEPGITRTQTNVTAFDMEATNALGIPEEAMKFTSKGGKDAFDPSKYLNIWVCDLLQASAFGGVAGYTIFPIGGVFGTVGSSYDGIVLDYQIGLSGRSITHEIGHYFGLYHPWGDALNDPNCLSDDGISDTPETDGANYICNYNTSSCNTLDMVENFMDYSTCPWMFTNGQKTVMYNTINSLRTSLLNSSACGPVDITENYKKNMFLYPNPTKGILTYSGNSLYDFMIFDVFGNAVLNFIEEEKTLDISFLENGLYTIVFKNDDLSIFYQKVILNK